MNNQINHYCMRYQGTYAGKMSSKIGSGISSSCTQRLFLQKSMFKTH